MERQAIRRALLSVADKSGLEPQAREVIERLVGASADWASLSDCLADFLPQQAPRVSAIASSFGASLELAREGRIELQQDKPFAPLYLRRRGPRAAN